MKYIVVTGGVLSGLGKGVVAASIGRILKDRGLNVIPIKIDGYVNVDPGTMNPYEHGEVYVLDDGAETDLDLGHYERFLNINLTRDSSITTGMIYKSVIEKERRGDYLGKTVQIIPHVTNEIKERIKNVSADIVLIEVGGTIGDMESMVFIEALRQMSIEENNKFLFVHLAYVPVISSGEEKTKPAQRSVKELQSMGVQPDIIIARCQKELTDDARRKIALFCNVKESDVLSDPDLKEIYELPIVLNRQNIGGIITKKMRLERTPPYTFHWEHYIERMKDYKRQVDIAVVGKYTELEDAYLSIKEAFKHAGMYNSCNVNLEWVGSDDGNADLSTFDGILVPGGFGSRGVEGKIAAVRYARANGVPFLGICLGLHMTVIEFARDVCKIQGANTTEADPETKNPVIDLIPEQKEIDDMGGTMRLGAFPCAVKAGTLAYKLYKTGEISERHRHRWEVNPKYIEILEKNGLVFSGIYQKRNLMEIVELPSHPFFIACQFHPEFKSRLEKPAPLFCGLVGAALEEKSKRR